MTYIFRVSKLFRNIFRAFVREKYRKIKEREKYIHIARVTFFIANAKKYYQMIDNN